MTNPTKSKRTNRQVGVRMSIPEVGMTGYRLIQAIDQTMIDRQMQLKEVADALDIPLSDLSRLRCGRLVTNTLSRKRLQSIAEFLQISMLSVMLLSEHVVAEEFDVTGDRGNGVLSARIDRACRFIHSDPEWGGIMPTSLFEQTDVSTRLFFVWCYEMATGTVLIPDAANYLKFLKEQSK